MLDPQTATNSRLLQYIPKELLQKLETARNSGAMSGERRIVTMLFCDVKGSTAAAEQMDPEEWSDIINGAFELMIRPVYQYEGTLARLMGDGLLAFFGAPIAHEDDPQRAILTGLDILAAIQPYRGQIKQRYGFDFDVRVGINTGLVVVGEVGSDLRMEYTALGDAINLASRMEQTASPGTVQISHDTYKLVKELFEFEDLGGIAVKGKDQPVPAYRVIKRKILAYRPRGIEGLHAEMVGRENEMIAMRSMISSLKQGVGQIVCVLGDAGLGKSRLVQETFKVFEERIYPNGSWYEILSLSYELHQAYGLLQRLIRRMNGLTRDDLPAVVGEKISQLVEALPEGRRKRALQVFETLFNLESRNGKVQIEGEAFKREMLDVICDWWRTSFAERPIVLVFDDMHWSDAASVELIVQLLPLIGEIPLVIICAMRPERNAPAWLIKTAADTHYHHLYHEISLQPLSDLESNELISRLLAVAEIPDSLRFSILEKAGGNPFFIEEVVRTLIDTEAVVSEERTSDGRTQRYWVTSGEATAITLPENLQSLLAARIDRLEEGTRGTLQMASVIGRSFYHRVLQAVDETDKELDEHLDTLLQVDMIREAARLPEVEYVFRNPLTHEAVYETILHKRRREFHRRVGEAIEQLYPDRIEGLYGLLANHFTLAGMHDKAVHYSRQAARQAVEVYAYEDAVQNLLAALALIPEGERNEAHLNLLEELGDAYNNLRDGERTIETYQRAIALGEEMPDIDPMETIRLHRKILQMVAEIKWSVGIGRLRSAHQSREASRKSLEKSLEFLQSRPPEEETVNVLVALSIDSWRIQDPPDLDAAQHFAESAVESARKLGKAIDLSHALGALATVFDGRSLLRESLKGQHSKARNLFGSGVRQ